MSTPTPAEPGQEAAAEPEPVPAEPGQEAAAEPEPVPAEPDPDAAPETQPAEPAAAETESAETESVETKPRPRGRTAKIMAAAVVLGVLGGAGTGYAVQAGRKQTPLPPLAVTQPAYPKAHRTAPVLAAAQDDMVKTDGDLTKLLVPIPSGAKPWDTPRSADGWLDLYAFSQEYRTPDGEMRYQLSHGFRRAAVQTWMQGGVSYEVDLVQYRHDQEVSAGEFVQDQVQYAISDTGSADPLTIPNSSLPELGVYSGSKELHYDDGTGYHRAYAFGTHGDICVEIMVFSPGRIDAKPLLTLLQNQMERL